jgi:hypothetical protein
VQGKSSLLETLEEVVLLALAKDMEDGQGEARPKSSHPSDPDHGKLYHQAPPFTLGFSFMAHIFL